ncbi:unnamed protein product [Dracunculus medinensis]|uniref:Mitochondrial import inner membrane translocase subunit TIM23 n=1 Tax=Dracunculus medinensis TaxID=318479 RepID=A0A0N4U7G5_DRAME|nr:unnamed protein product [Dracunculus medinensis]
MVWLFGPSKPQVQMVAVDDNHDLSSSLTSDLSSDNNISRLPQPMIALDEIKQSGLPIHQQIAPYLQMDPSVFQQATPEYVMPVGTTGKGKFEFALGNIGWGVIGGYSFGCMRGFLPEFFNRDTKQLRGKPWVTRMVNATVKHGSGYAQPAGAIVVMYSLLELILRKLRADDDLNSIAAGGLTGAIYRSPYGLRASAVGSIFGFAIATLWVLAQTDSRQRITEINYF